MSSEAKAYALRECFVYVSGYSYTILFPVNPVEYDPVRYFFLRSTRGRIYLAHVSHRVYGPIGPRCVVDSASFTQTSSQSRLSTHPPWTDGLGTAHCTLEGRPLGRSARSWYLGVRRRCFGQCLLSARQRMRKAFNMT